MSLILMEKSYAVGSNSPITFFLTHVPAVSQFTLLASTKKGSKPDFHGAMGGEQAKELYQRFVQKVQEGYKPERVKDGVFQAMMEVALVNDGPVSTINPSMRYHNG
jgi:D-tyrosyl-tRNA(Tyr) deacylase